MLVFTMQTDIAAKNGKVSEPLPGMIFPNHFDGNVEEGEPEDGAVDEGEGEGVSGQEGGEGVPCCRGRGSCRAVVLTVRF